jgi:MFS family permease
MPTVVAQLGGLDLYAWTFSAYLLSSTVAVPIYGKLADLYGRKPTFLIATGIFV